MTIDCRTPGLAVGTCRGHRLGGTPHPSGPVIQPSSTMKIQVALTAAPFSGLMARVHAEGANNFAVISAASDRNPRSFSMAEMSLPAARRLQRALTSS